MAAEFVNQRLHRKEPATARQQDGAPRDRNSGLEHLHSGHFATAVQAGALPHAAGRSLAGSSVHSARDVDQLTPRPWKGYVADKAMGVDVTARGVADDLTFVRRAGHALTGTS